MNILELISLLLQLFIFLFCLWLTIKIGRGIIEDWFK